MKKALILCGVIVAVLLAVGGSILLSIRSQRPEVLLERLARGKGDREELIMRINVARGDVISPMIEAVKNKGNAASFRADILELLAKRNCRSAEQRMEDVILQATKDPELLIRRRAVYCIGVYGEDRLRTELVNSVDDPDPEIRRQVYLVMGARAGSSLWKSLSSQQKDRLIKVCLKRMKTEDMPELQLLARAVIGREIETRGVEARQALQVSDIAGAEKILRGALELDPANCQAQIRLVRFHLRTGDRAKALELAKQYGALIEIPQLSQAPVIDADPTDQVWAQAYTTERFYHTTSLWIQRLTKGKSKAHIGHLNGKIYIAIIGYEEDLSKLVQAQRGRDSDVWNDDCVELVFDPDNTDSKYYQFVVNAAGALYDIANGDTGKNFKCRYAAKVFHDRGYWACEFSLDGKDLDNHLIEPGTIWSLNVFRVRIGPASEHGAIWPLFGWTHRMDLYPLAIFK